MQVLAILFLFAIPLLICIGVWFLTNSIAWVLITLGGILFLMFLLGLIFYLKVFKAASDMASDVMSNLREV